MIEVRLFDDLGAVEADAGAALGRAAQASLYDRLDWFRLNERHGVARGRPIVARAREGAAACWLFLRRRGAARVDPMAAGTRSPSRRSSPGAR